MSSLADEWRATLQQLGLRLDAEAPFAAFEALRQIADRIEGLERVDAVVLALKLGQALETLAPLLQQRLPRLAERAELEAAAAAIRGSSETIRETAQALRAAARDLGASAAAAARVEEQGALARALEAECAQLDSARAADAAWRTRIAALEDQRDRLRREIAASPSGTLMGEIEREARSLIGLRRQDIERLSSGTRTALDDLADLEETFALARDAARRAQERLADFHRTHPEAEALVRAYLKHAESNAGIAEALSDDAALRARIAALGDELRAIDAELRLLAEAGAAAMPVLGLDGKTIS